MRNFLTVPTKWDAISIVNGWIVFVFVFGPYFGKNASTAVTFAALSYGLLLMGSTVAMLEAIIWRSMRNRK